MISFTDSSGEPERLLVDVATTDLQQERGLMDIAYLPPDRGELFDFTNVSGGREIRTGFWMCDTLIPLSVAFIGKDDVVHEIQDMDALSLIAHVPSAPYLYAVEANLGWYAQHGIGPGSPVDLSAALNQATQSQSP